MLSVSEGRPTYLRIALRRDLLLLRYAKLPAKTYAIVNQVRRKSGSGERAVERLTEYETDGETVFKLRVPQERAEVLRRHLTSLLELMALDAPKVEAREEIPDMPPGMLLKRMRTDRGMTQRAVAALIGVNQSRVSDMEQGVRPIPAEAAVTLGKTFGIPAGRFLL